MDTSYQEAIQGRDEPDYMLVATPYGYVELTPKVITGSKEAIQYMEKLFGWTEEKTNG
jgi:hypothetical protein